MTELYLVAPEGLHTEAGLNHFAESLEAALAAGPVAALLLRRAQMNERHLAIAAARLGAPAQAHGVAVLAEDSARAAAALDGIHLSTAGQDVTALRQEIGPEAIVGVDCGRSRHRAMKAGEAGADYVAFTLAQPLADNDLELVAAWHQVTLVPQVVMTEADLEGARRLARAGADFLALGGRLWNHPQGPAAAIEAYAQALALDAGRC